MSCCNAQRIIHTYIHHHHQWNLCLVIINTYLHLNTDSTQNEMFEIGFSLFLLSIIDRKLSSNYLLLLILYTGK